MATGWQESYNLLVRPRVGELLWNTVRLYPGDDHGQRLDRPWRGVAH